MEKKTFVSVVVPTYNRKDMLKECLDALSKQTYPQDCYEVLVVNNGSKDGTEEFLGEYRKNAAFDLKPLMYEKKGVCGARNFGIKNSRGEIICFTDDDCLADKDWIKNLADSYISDEIGCVGGEILAYPPKTILEKYADRRKIVGQIFLACGPVVTANTSYRKKVLMEVNAFDEQLPTSEDSDLGVRVKLKNYKFVYAKNAIVLHKHRSTLRGFLKQQYYYGVGYVRLHRKFTENFKAQYILLSTPPKIIYLMLTYPLRILKSPFVKGKKYYLAEPFLDVVTASMRFFGLINENLFGKPYPGKKYGKLDFIKEKSAFDVFKRTKEILSSKSEKD